MRKDELIVYSDRKQSIVQSVCQSRDSPVQNPCPWLHQPNIVTLSIVIIHAGPYLCKIKMV